MLRTWRCAGCLKVVLDNRCQCYKGRIMAGGNTGDSQWVGVWIVPDNFLIVQDIGEDDV